jgi:lipopolysaccharide biosynthesis glycosyltransferase
MISITFRNPTNAVEKERKSVLSRSICPVVVAGDEGYAMPLATTLRSIVEANQWAWPLGFHVLSTGFAAATKARIERSLPCKSASIRWVSVDLAGCDGFSTNRHISRMTYARLFIHDVLPEGTSKVLYVDADLLVLDDLKPLWETDLGGAVLAAVLDEMDLGVKSSDPRFAGVPRVRDYFNAGVMLIDLARWRQERVSARALQYLVSKPRSPFSDQDALNVACDGLWKRLDPRWNFQNHYCTRITDISPKQRPGIVHFVTGSKPWIPGVRSVNAAFYDEFRSRTRFARTPFDRVRDSVWRLWAGAGNVVRRHGLLSEKD